MGSQESPSSSGQSVKLTRTRRWFCEPGLIFSSPTSPARAKVPIARIVSSDLSSQWVRCRHLGIPIGRCNAMARKDRADAIDEAAQMQAEIQKLGKGEFLRDVRSAARNAISQLPDSSEVEKLDSTSRQYFEQIAKVVEAGLGMSQWDDQEVTRFVRDVSWAQLCTGVAAIALQNTGGGPGGQTCPTDCENEYDKCMKEHDCTHSFICICCVPCSLRYMGCMASCIRKGKSGGLTL
jgi:hypothetical protein